MMPMLTVIIKKQIHFYDKLKLRFLFSFFSTKYTNTPSRTQSWTIFHISPPNAHPA
jgi:hypothetical protein